MSFSVLVFCVLIARISDQFCNTGSLQPRGNAEIVPSMFAVRQPNTAFRLEVTLDAPVNRVHETSAHYMVHRSKVGRCAEVFIGIAGFATNNELFYLAPGRA